MGLRIVVGEGESVRDAVRRLAERMMDEGVTDVLRHRSPFEGRFESRRATRWRRRGAKRDQEYVRAWRESQQAAAEDSQVAAPQGDCFAEG